MYMYSSISYSATLCSQHFSLVSELSDGKADTITTSILELLTSLDLAIIKVMGFWLGWRLSHGWAKSRCLQNH